MHARGNVNPVLLACLLSVIRMSKAHFHEEFKSQTRFHSKRSVKDRAWSYGPLVKGDAISNKLTWTHFFARPSESHDLSAGQVAMQLSASSAAPVQMKHAELMIVMWRQGRFTLGHKNGKKDMLQGRGGERWDWRSASCSYCYQWVGQHEGLACCSSTASAATPETMILPSKPAKPLLLHGCSAAREVWEGHNNLVILSNLLSFLTRSIVPALPDCRSVLSKMSSLPDLAQATSLCSQILMMLFQ